MFTGLIQKIGILKQKDRQHGGTSMVVGHEPWDRPVEAGESIAVNGVCLTVTASTSHSFACDALDETLSVTSLGSRAVGAQLNLERALRAGDAIGGHFVTGHVDGQARLASKRNAARDFVLRFEAAPDLIRGLVMKGSVACDGISLTVSAISDTWFEVNVIPYTMAQTTLRQISEGDPVNIETDMLGKFVRRQAEACQEKEIGLDDLRTAGFID